MALGNCFTGKTACARRSARLFLLPVLFGLFVLPEPGAAEPNAAGDEIRPRRCFFVSSHDAEDPWTNEIAAGLKAEIGNACELETFHLDTGNHPRVHHAVQMAARAYRRMREIRPDVVIACDDSASRYFVVPYLRETAYPVVFCGVDWTVEHHGYPFANATGIIEFAPIKVLLKDTALSVEEGRTLIYLAADQDGQHDFLKRVETTAAEKGFSVDARFVGTMSEWADAFNMAGNRHVVMFGPVDGIEDWDLTKAQQTIAANPEPFTITTTRAMAPLAMLTMTNTGVEHGEWAGAVVRLLIDGEQPSNIPIVASRKWIGFQNGPLLDRAGYKLPITISHHLRPYQ